jgi:fucose 4-O-acetylase-like acetyltransferase
MQCVMNETIDMRSEAESDKNTLQWIHVAKGIGIFLVVVGHFATESSPTYWSEMRNLIYSFHMPLFFILSGYLYKLGKYSYRDLIRNKTKRLLYPFATIAGAFFLIKYMAGQIVHLDNPVNTDIFFALLTNPVHSHMPLLWFIHALFLIFIIYPLARLFMNNLALLLFLVGIISVIGSDYPVFGNALAYMPFFVFGVILRENVQLSKMPIDADWRYVVAPLVLFLLIYIVSYNFEPIYVYLSRFILGVFGSLFVINLSQTISILPHEKIKSILLQIGYCSMTIYLFHTLFEGTVRIGFLPVFKYIQAPFELIASIAIIGGVFFPIVLEKKVLRKYWITRHFVLGLT